MLARTRPELILSLMVDTPADKGRGTRDMRRHDLILTGMVIVAVHSVQMKGMKINSCIHLCCSCLFRL